MAKERVYDKTEQDWGQFVIHRRCEVGFKVLYYTIIYIKFYIKFYYLNKKYAYIVLYYFHFIIN